MIKKLSKKKKTLPAKYISKCSGCKNYKFESDNKYLIIANCKQRILVYADYGMVIEFWMQNTECVHECKYYKKGK